MEIKLPQELTEILDTFLEANPTWTVDRIATTAIALFMMQECAGTVPLRTYRPAARIYLDGKFE